MGNSDVLTGAGKLKSFFLEITGWIIPLVVSAPSLFIWAGLMTMPLILYLGIMFLSFFDPSINVKCCEGPYFLTALDVMLLGGPYWPDKVFSILGVLIMIYSTVYLNRKRKFGLVTTGPYRWARNPQYFGAILFIINMTSRSYKEVLGDVGWIGPNGTLLIWFGTLVAYIFLALVEEAHLAKVFGDEYVAYKRNTPFLIPFIGTGRCALEIGVSVIVPIVLLWTLVRVNRGLYP
jgi:protein-S-isoprenylcysteine O-methyltransferase Ste14